MIKGQDKFVTTNLWCLLELLACYEEQKGQCHQEEMGPDVKE